MERLSGLDASFLYNETPSLHMHTLKYAVLDVRDVEGGFSVERLEHELERRLHLLPPFRRRVVEVPLGLHHPVWIEDPDFDLSWHVRRVGVPAPGGRAEMDALIAEIASWQLDRRHPLWECWVLEGLAEGRVGFLVKMHHSLADGVAAAALLANVMETAPDAVDPPPPVTPWVPDQRPGAWRLLVDAVVDGLHDIGRLPGLVVRTISGMRAVSRRRRSGAVAAPRPLDTDTTPFNGSLTPHRAFATADLSLADVKRVKDACGVTINDVVLGLVGGSLRSYLLSVDALPAKPLLAGVPVASDAGGTTRLHGNKVSNLFTSLRTDLADPIARLEAIHEVTGAAKEVHNLMGAEMMADWSEYAPPRPYAWFMRSYSRLNLADRHRPPINLVVSNVPGPRDPLYIAGARLDGIYSVGPVVEGVGLNVTVWSYLDRIHVGAIGCREHWKDLHVVTEGMQAALDELLDLISDGVSDPVIQEA